MVASWANISTNFEKSFLWLTYKTLEKKIVRNFAIHKLTLDISKTKKLYKIVKIKIEYLKKIVEKKIHHFSQSVKFGQFT